MTDKKDVHTVDAFPLKKRGRPATGNALTSAQRKARQRAKDWMIVTNSINQLDFKEMTTTGLLEKLGTAISTKNHSLAKALSEELLKRAN